MKNISENEKLSTILKSSDTSLTCIKKRSWLSHKIEDWETGRIEAAGGGHLDAGLQTYD